MIGKRLEPGDFSLQIFDKAETQGSPVEITGRAVGKPGMEVDGSIVTPESVILLRDHMSLVR